jgi:hypothetical protein
MLDSRLLSVPDIASLTGWSVAKIRSLCRNGKLPAVDSGSGKRSVWFVTQANLERFLSGELTPSATSAATPAKPRKCKTRIDSAIKNKRF